VVTPNASKLDQHRWLGPVLLAAQMGVRCIVLSHDERSNLHIMFDVMLTLGIFARALA
jgi:hypothetical protein